MDGFSSAMKLTGLDDFIAPSQACVKPLEAPKPTSKRSIIRFAPALRGVELSRSGGSLSVHFALACAARSKAVLISAQHRGRR